MLVAGLGVLAIAYSLLLFARKFAGAGAVYEYLTHGAHPSVGIFTAGIFFVGTLFLGRWYLPRPRHPHQRLLGGAHHRRQLCYKFLQDL